MTELGKPQKNFADTFSAVTAIKNEAYPEPVAEPVAWNNGWINDWMGRHDVVLPNPAYAELKRALASSTIPQPSPPDRDAIRKGALEAVIDAKVAEIDQRYANADHGAQRSMGYAIDRLSEVRDSIRALASDPTPEDWVLVPREPTAAMLLAGEKHVGEIININGKAAINPELWRAMIAASPKGPRE